MPAIDLYKGKEHVPTGPARVQFNITPHATNELQHVVRAIHVGVAGNLHIADGDGNVLDPFPVQAGQYVGQVRRVISPGTTATGLVGKV